MTTGAEAITRARSEAERQAASITMIVELERQAANIGDIVRAVARIADRTNPLALHAAIEASRAGIHGAGFKVIAGQLQDLARASQSAMAEAQVQGANVQRAIGRVLTAGRGGAGAHAEQPLRP